MPNEADRQAHNVAPPYADATPGVGVTALSTSTTSATHDLDTYENLFGRYIALKADGGKIYVSFDDDSTGSIDETAVAATVAAGTTEAVPWPITDGETIYVRLTRATHRYLHTKAATGTPTLRIRAAAQKGPLTPKR